MAFDIGQIIQQQLENNQNRISQLEQLQSKPQGGILNQIDPSWLALAQGFLAPTKTGGFGESLANAAGQLQGPLAQMKQQQLSAQEKIEKLKESQAKLAMDWYKAQKGGSDDDATSIYRDYRNEKMIESLYGSRFKPIDKEIEKNKAILDPKNFLVEDADRDRARAAIDKLQAQREALEAQMEEEKASKGLGGRKRSGAPQPQAQPQAQPQSQPQAQEQDIKSHPEVKEAVRLYNENKGRINPADLPLKKKQIVDRLNQHGIKADESIFAD